MFLSSFDIIIIMIIFLQGYTLYLANATADSSDCISDSNILAFIN